MGRTWQSEEVAALTATINLDDDVVYFPVRHHSPACAWHVQQLIRELRPDQVLIEGPRDATPLIPMIRHPDTRMPIAIYTTYVIRQTQDLPLRHAAYYPLCDFSPEYTALSAAHEVGAEAKFIDLTFPEKIEAERKYQPPVDLPIHVKPRSRPHSLQDESWYSHSRLLQAACVRTGARDADDLWDHLFEVDYQDIPSHEFIRRVLAYCRLARRDHAQPQLAAEGCLAREQAMAAEIADTTGRTLVVTGGFHTVTLPDTRPARPRPVKAKPADHQMVLMRYTFAQLDRLNGYASGMPAPGFYQRRWDGQDPARILVEVARTCRKRELMVSTADAVASLRQTRGLARLRGHATTSREDVLDGIRSVFIKGAADAEGIPVMAIARHLMTGDRIGQVPPEAGQPPIVHDFRNTAARLKLKLDKLSDHEVVLDLYRKQPHREISRLFHRLDFLEVPFAYFRRGPDFVHGQQLERIQEVWTYRWSPQTESTLIEQSVFGSTVEEAANARLLERFHENEKQGQGRSASVATELILHACRMGLHKHTTDLLDRLGGLLAADASFASVVQALDNLLVLEVSREPLEAHHLSGLHELAVAAYQRACFLVPMLVSTVPEEEALVLGALNALYQAAQSLGDDPGGWELRTDALWALAKTTGGCAAARGGALGILHADGAAGEADLEQYLRGHLFSSRTDSTEGADFLRGLLQTARHVLWQVPRVLACLHESLAAWDEDRFIQLLPSLRLALADLTPRETNDVARSVARLVGVEQIREIDLPDVAPDEMLHAVRLNERVRALLLDAGLENFYE